MVFFPYKGRKDFQEFIDQKFKPRTSLLQLGIVMGLLQKEKEGMASRLQRSLKRCHPPAISRGGDPGASLRLPLWELLTSGPQSAVQFPTCGEMAAARKVLSLCQAGRTECNEGKILTQSRKC